mgnify:CR=1 FL=1
MYTCEHFAIHEFVPPAVYKDRGERAWSLMDQRVLITADRLRKRYGAMTVNNWKWGGDRQWSGLRTPQSPYYRQFSQHSFGRAIDAIFNDVTAEEVRQDILANPEHKDFELIMSIEAEVSWLHFDVRNCKRIQVFQP